MWVGGVPDLPECAPFLSSSMTSFGSEMEMPLGVCVGYDALSHPQEQELPITGLPVWDHGGCSEPSYSQPCDVSSPVKAICDQAKTQWKPQRKQHRGDRIINVHSTLWFSSLD